MINKILGKFGFKKIKRDFIKEIEAEREERDKWFKAYDRAALERNAAWEAFENKKKQIRELEKEIDSLKEREAEFKSRLADEIQKRFELAEKLEECEADRNNWELIASDYKQHLDHLEIGLNLADLLKREEPENAESVGEKNV